MAIRIPKLKRPPIREALIDFRVTSTNLGSSKTVKSFSELMQQAYPVSQPIRVFEHAFEFGPEGGKSSNSNYEEGVKLTSENSNLVIQARQVGLTLSMLEPYSNWPELLSQFKTVWDAYLRIFQPKSVSRIAVRYINEIEIPRVPGSLNEWLKITNNLPSSFAFGLQNELSRFEMHEDNTDCTVLLTQVIESHGQSWSVVLDIDAIKQKEYDCLDSSIWGDLENLRNLKNKVFFGSLKKKAIETFK